MREREENKENKIERIKSKRIELNRLKKRNEFEPKIHKAKQNK
jgi:hypothetical protein